MIGKKTTADIVDNHMTRIDMTNQSAGLYLFVITDDKGNKCIKKIVKQ